MKKEIFERYLNVQTIDNKERLRLIETPAYIIDLNQIEKNFINIDDIRNATGVKIFLALKGFSNDMIINQFINKLDGLSSSGLFESKLGKELNVQVSTFFTAYTDNIINEICKSSEYIIFNSINQYKKYLTEAQNNNCSIGIRINPEYTELSDEFAANTCKKDSHLGIKKKNMPPIQDFCKGKIEGIHFHTMCEQQADTLERTIEYIIKNYDKYLKRIKWINLGGGQLLSASNYDVSKAIYSLKKIKDKYKIEVILEPCEGIMLNSGYYITKVIDILNNNMNLAIVDGSAVCHMIDAAYRGWSRDIIGESTKISKDSHMYKIVGSSCYAGDSFGTYYLNKELKVGDNIIFKDTASYTMVKNNMFNGIAYPNLYVIDLNKNVKKIKEYDYNIFKMII